MYYINSSLNHLFGRNLNPGEEIQRYQLDGFLPVSRGIAQLSWLYIHREYRSSYRMEFNSKLGCKSLSVCDEEIHILEAGMLEEILEDVFLYFNLSKDNSILVEVREYDNLD